MVNRTITCALKSALLLLFLFLGALPEAWGQDRVVGDFDPRNLSGIWQRRGGPSAFEGFGRDTQPELTPRAIEIIRDRVPSPAAAPHQPLSPDVPFPYLSNDPEYQCNPAGFPKLLIHVEPVEFIMFPDRMLQVFQWEHRMRYIWLDGRELPSGENLDNLGPAWYGHSVGRWEGDTLVVDTVGLDERAWLDRPGNTISLHGRIEERYRRIDSDTIELEWTLYDPANYFAPWSGVPRTFRREPPENDIFFGWSGLFSGITESICSPMDEADDYNRRFRNPAALGASER